MMHKKEYFYKMKRLYENSIKVEGIMDQAVWFVINNQLKDKSAWEAYIDVFSTREDVTDEKWRGEYFGKQMRGACFAYQYTKDEELYNILTWACEELLKTQDELGRISTYTSDHEFCGWDMWCRKYVLTGLQHYYRICKDEELKEKILTACCKHLDYIQDKIGEGKIEVSTTSKWWGAVNSSTILEPTMELYKMTGYERYLDFAKYIISRGGSSDCNLVELALEDKLMPYQYPVTKAYEMMSFYEGLLAYYEVTGEEKYFEAADKFYEAVAKSDITIIGCSGCTHELFDNSALKQTEYAENIMQETCVTVTWIRVMTRMYLLTKDAKYIDRIEKSGYNALYGSLNTKGCKQFELVSGEYLEPKTFDSYSPLYMNTRGRGVGGYLKFANGQYGGCCVAIGACGISLMPLAAVMCDGDTIYINHQFKGEAVVTDTNGQVVGLEFDSDYPTETTCKITIHCEGKCQLNLKIRKPYWCKEMKVDGNAVCTEGYFELSGQYQDNQTIAFAWPTSLKVHRLNEKVAFTYGAITLACDTAKSDREIAAPVVVPDEPTYQILEPEEDELVRIECDTCDGKILLTDYQSCGKDWLSEKNIITVWLNTK